MLYSRRVLLVLLSLACAACAHEPPAPTPPPAPRVAVAPLPDLSARDAADRAIERTVREVLELAGISTFDVFVRSRAGQVLLSGDVTNPATAESIASITGRIKNVRGVRQELRVISPAAPTPLATEEGGFGWAWPLATLAALALGFFLGRRRRPIASRNLSTANAKPTPLRETPPAHERAS